MAWSHISPRWNVSSLNLIGRWTAQSSWPGGRAGKKPTWPCAGSPRTSSRTGNLRRRYELDAPPAEIGVLNLNRFHNAVDQRLGRLPGARQGDKLGIVHRRAK